jgi:hypothetical protein
VQRDRELPKPRSRSGEQPLFFFYGEPAIPRVVFLLHGDAADRVIGTPFPLTPRQIEGLRQRGEFPVDRAGFST